MNRTVQSVHVFKNFARQLLFNVRSVVMSSFAESIFLVGGIRQQFSQYMMFIRQYSSKEGIVIVGNQLLQVRSIWWVQTSTNSTANKRLKTLFVSRRGISQPGTDSIRQLAEHDRLVDMTLLYSIVSSILRLLNILRAWSDCAHLLTTCRTFTLTERLLLTVTPRIFRLVTRSIPGTTGVTRKICPCSCCW